MNVTRAMVLKECRRQWGERSWAKTNHGAPVGEKRTELLEFSRRHRELRPDKADAAAYKQWKQNQDLYTVRLCSHRCEAGYTSDLMFPVRHIRGYGDTWADVLAMIRPANTSRDTLS